MVFAAMLAAKSVGVVFGGGMDDVFDVDRFDCLEVAGALKKVCETSL